MARAYRAGHAPYKLNHDIRGVANKYARSLRNKRNTLARIYITVIRTHDTRAYMRKGLITFNFKLFMSPVT